MVTEISPRRWLEEAALNRRWFDVIIFAGGKQYRAHKTILSSASSFLRGILLSRSSDDYSCIVLADVSPVTVELILQYVYTGEVSLLQEQVESFIALAKILQLHIDKDVICERKHKHREIDPKSVNSTNSVLLNILSDVNLIQKSDDKTYFKNEKERPDIKYENSANNNLDLEVLIKSDKISKCSMNNGIGDFAIGQSGFLNGRYPKVCEFYKKMQYFGRTYFEEKLKDKISDLRVVNADNKCVDDECRSTSSCEIIEPALDRSLTKVSSTLCYKNDRTESVPFRELKQNHLTTSILSTHNDNPLNLMKSPHSQYHVDDNNRNNVIDYSINEENILNQGYLTNHEHYRLIKPIPSLMPIDRLSMEQSLRSSPVLLDLSAVRRKLHRNVHSAFQEVIKHHSNNLNPNHINHKTLQTNNLFSNSYDVQNSIFQINQFQTDNPINIQDRDNNISPLRNDRIENQEFAPKTKMLPRNRVMSGPWSTRSPTFFKPGRRTPLSAPKQANDAADLQRNTQSVQSYIYPEISSQPELDKTSSSITERSNDSNNNFDTYNCNNISHSISSPFYQLGEKEKLSDDSNGQSDRHFVINSPISISVTSPRDEEHFRGPDDDHRNKTNYRTVENHLKPIEQYSAIQNESNVEFSVKTEDFLVNDCEKSILKCEFCDKVFTSKDNLAIHSGSHTSRARYKCDQCDKCFSQLRNYKYHVSVHRGTKEFAATCNVCGKYFNDRGYLSSHMKIHRNRKEYQCPHCPKSFNQRVAYNMHVRIHTGIKPHQCEECGKAFSRKMLLKQHARTHSGEKPYACTSCGKRFADRSNMTLHMRLHSGVKPFSCTLCPKSFTKKHHLKTHLNYHTGNKPYACIKCGLTFSQSSNMRTHMKKCTLPDPPNLHEVHEQHSGKTPELTAT